VVTGEAVVDLSHLTEPGQRGFTAGFTTPMVASTGPVRLAA
jgi:hypothetical protein